MGYQKIINLLDNTNNQPSKFKTKNWVDLNDDAFEHTAQTIKSKARLQC